MKYRLLFILTLLFVYASSCDPDDEIEPFDHAAQAIIDNDSLVDYMQTHYLDMNGELQEITNNEAPVFDQVITQTITHEMEGEDVEYKLYHLKGDEGNGAQPTRVDSVHVSYKGILLDDEVFDQQSYGVWFPLYGVIAGWEYGIPNFKAGEYIVNPDTSFNFFNNGTGILFVPSGLGYANLAQTYIPANSPLVFYIELNLVERTDTDRDGLLSMYEDINDNGDFSDDDTDEDEFPNYVDADDDGDTIPTSEELGPDPIDPMNLLDTDADGTPDYLDTDDDNDGTPTADEVGDDPTNPIDTDDDGIPDYLDEDN